MVGEGNGERRKLRGKTRGREGQICRTLAFLLMISKSNRKQLKDFNQCYDMIQFAFLNYPFVCNEDN